MVGQCQERPLSVLPGLPLLQSDFMSLIDNSAACGAGLFAGGLSGLQAVCQPLLSAVLRWLVQGARVALLALSAAAAIAVLAADPGPSCAASVLGCRGKVGRWLAVVGWVPGGGLGQGCTAAEPGACL